VKVTAYSVGPKYSPFLCEDVQRFGGRNIVSYFEFGKRNMTQNTSLFVITFSNSITLHHSLSSSEQCINKYN
jgi:hypothetical protein